jgi:transcriptional regulator with XRE-family HTH domain
VLYRHALGEIIRETRLAQKKNLRHISKDARVALGYLSEVERGQKEASSEIVREIANALNIPAHQLVIEAGFRMAQLSIPDTVEAMFADDLTLSQA